tara:strand:- start:161 stop:280 length:120 start_codon:yes stop_codon:yes gene_type:complete
MFSIVFLAGYNGFLDWVPDLLDKIRDSDFMKDIKAILFN